MQLQCIFRSTGASRTQKIHINIVMLQCPNVISTRIGVNYNPNLQSYGALLLLLFLSWFWLVNIIILMANGC